MVVGALIVDTFAKSGRERKKILST